MNDGKINHSKHLIKLDRLYIILSLSRAHTHARAHTQHTRNAQHAHTHTTHTHTTHTHTHTHTPHTPHNTHTTHWGVGSADQLVSESASICSPVPVFLCLLSILYGVGACLCCQGKIPLQSSAASDWLTSFSSTPPPATAFLPSPVRSLSLAFPSCLLYTISYVTPRPSLSFF